MLTELFMAASYWQRLSTNDKDERFIRHCVLRSTPITSSVTRNELEAVCNVQFQLKQLEGGKLKRD